MRHPSTEIHGTEQSDVAGMTLVLGVTGSAAAYRSVDLARKLMRMGAAVRVAMTPAAASLVAPTLFEWATGSPVVTKMTGMVEHVMLAESCNAVVVAPATLDFISGLVTGRASNIVLACAQEALGLGKPVLVVPAMHTGLWRRAAKLVEEARRQGVHVMEPVVEEGRPKMPPVDLVAWWVEAVLSRGEDLAGFKVLVTGGPTWEFIDPVRVITNPSSGRMGVSIALEAAFRGATVTLVHGPILEELKPPSTYVNAVEVTTTEEMVEAVAARCREADVVVYAAAPADYAPEKRFDTKLPSRGGPLDLRLVPTPKVVERARRECPEVVHVAFAAEAVESEDELVEKAREKLELLGVDVVAANPVNWRGAGFRARTNKLVLVTKRGVTRLPLMPKRMAARRVLDEALRALEKRG